MEVVDTSLNQWALLVWSLGHWLLCWSISLNRRCVLFICRRVWLLCRRVSFLGRRTSPLWLIDSLLQLLKFGLHLLQNKVLVQNVAHVQQFEVFARLAHWGFVIGFWLQERWFNGLLSHQSSLGWSQVGSRGSLTCFLKLRLRLTQHGLLSGWLLNNLFLGWTAVFHLRLVLFCEHLVSLEVPLIFE